MISIVLLFLSSFHFSTSRCAPSYPFVRAPLGGSDDSSVKIVGGTDATPGEFPFIVSVQIKGLNGLPNYHSCGGILLTPSRVITAASCVRTRIASNFVISAGGYTLRETIEGHQQSRNVRRITHHPDFDPFGEIVHDDLAIIELSTAFDNTTTVKPSLPLARRSQEYSGVCQISGWGASSLGATNATNLMKGDVSIHPRTYCKNAYPQEYREDKQICANGVNGQGQVVDLCSGDLGGPLICANSDGTKYLAGVASYGHMCGAVHQPGVFMEVSKYRTWIDSFLVDESGSGGTTTTTTTPKPATSSTTTGTTKKPVGAPVDNPAVGGGDNPGLGYVAKPKPKCGESKK